MEWNREKTIELIEKYRDEECLWNVRSVLYKDRQRKQDAWSHLASELNIPVSEAQAKMRNMKVQWNSEKKKVDKSMRSGAGSSGIYSPKWFAYRHLMFLVEVGEGRTTQSNMVSTTRLFPKRTIK